MTTAGVTRRRPRDRRQQIIRSAAGLFRRSGYHGVGITDIATAEGITSAALYRHFTSKEDLLQATIRDAVSGIAGLGKAEHDGLGAVLERLCDLALSDRDSTVLWSRELRHLPAESQEELRAELRRGVQPLRRAISAVRSDLVADDVDLLLWSVLGVVGVTSNPAVRWESREARDELRRAADQCVRIPLPSPATGPATAAGGGDPPGRLLPASRQEAILTAAMRLFATRGFDDVGVDEIGAAAGITGGTVYHHFPSKSAILVATLTRALEAAFFDLSGVLDRAGSPGEALDGAVRCYVRTGVEHGLVLGALMSEISGLEDAERRRLRGRMIDYGDEWATLLQKHRPALSATEVRVRVSSAMYALNSLVLIPHLRRRPHASHDMAAVGRAVLGLDPPG